MVLKLSRFCGVGVTLEKSDVKTEFQFSYNSGYEMTVYIIFLIAMITSIAICVVLISRNANESYKGLKTSFLVLSNTHNGIFVDKGGLEGLSMQINVEGFDVIIKTIIKKRRKVTNWYALRISIFSKHKTTTHQKELSIADAVPNENLMKVILVMITELREKLSVSG